LAKPHRAAAAGAMRLLFSNLGQAILPTAAGGSFRALRTRSALAERFWQDGRYFKSIPSRLDV
jgi:hypothetical protein